MFIVAFLLLWAPGLTESAGESPFLTPGGLKQAVPLVPRVCGSLCFIEKQREGTEPEGGGQSLRTCDGYRGEAAVSLCARGNTWLTETHSASSARAQTRPFGFAPLFYLFLSICSSIKSGSDEFSSSSIQRRGSNFKL